MARTGAAPTTGPGHLGFNIASTSGRSTRKPFGYMGSVKIGNRMSWDKFVKRYVWDDVKTPYFVRVAKMNKIQAGHEIFAFSLFLVVLFLVISLASLSEQAPQGRSEAVSFYAFFVVFGAIFLAMTKRPFAAYVCASAPPAALLYFFFEGFPPGLGGVDKLLLSAATLAIFRYSLRVITIAKTYERMPGAAPEADAG